MVKTRSLFSSGDPCTIRFNELFILIRAQLASRDSVTSRLQKERDLAQDELANMNSVLEQETASLKFQLSTLQMELAQEQKVTILCVKY